MKPKKIAVLTSRESWFLPYARKLVVLLKQKGYEASLFSRHEKISAKFPIVFVLSYFRIITDKYLNRHKHNLVVHESSLPKNRGWSPLFWQILERKNKIPMVLFEAQPGIDTGEVYLKDYCCYQGHELNQQLRKQQAEKSISLCLKFLAKYGKLKVRKQTGRPSFCKKRSPQDSRLNINKTLKEQFDLLRIVNNEEFPAFFYHKKHKYILKIYGQRQKGN